MINLITRNEQFLTKCMSRYTYLHVKTKASLLTYNHCHSNGRTLVHTKEYVFGI